MELPDWPPELPAPGQEELPLFSAASNICLDFHGDPLQADLVIFSDGNHHMALQECVQRFHARQPDCRIFYATTPPGPVLTLLRQGSLRIGNLVLSVRPHLFLGPPHVLDSLEADGMIGQRRPFMQNRGAALLVRRDDPKTRNLDLPALARPGLRLFLSNPDTESVSFRATGTPSSPLVRPRAWTPVSWKQKMRPARSYTADPSTTGRHRRPWPKAGPTSRSSITTWRSASAASSRSSSPCSP
ncbi:substrate-binding domain-containing protein [Thermodesulfobacteriota bacterium B35]